MGLDHQYRLCGAAQSRHPAARGGHRTPSQYPLPRRSELAGSVGTVPGVSQLRVAPRQPASAPAGSHPYAWYGLGQAVATVYTSDGGGIDGSCVVAQRGPALSRATVATSSRIVRMSQEDERPTTRDRGVYKQERRAAQGADNPLRDPTTGCWVPLRRLKRGPMELSAPSRYATKI